MREMCRAKVRLLSKLEAEKPRFHLNLTDGETYGQQTDRRKTDVQTDEHKEL